MGRKIKIMTSQGVYEFEPQGQSADTWRNIQVNGSQVLGTSTDTGALNFVNGINTYFSYNTSTKTLSINSLLNIENGSGNYSLKQKVDAAHANQANEDYSSTFGKGNISGENGWAAFTTGTENTNSGDSAFVTGASNINSGFAAIIGGTSNSNTNRGVIVGGTNNINVGKNLLMVGQYNTITHTYSSDLDADNSLIGGKGNEINGTTENAVIAGSNNKINAQSSLTVGQDNENMIDKGAVIGYKLKTNNRNLIAFGKYNNDSTDLPNNVSKVFAIGNGYLIDTETQPIVLDASYTLSQPVVMGEVIYVDVEFTGTISSSVRTQFRLMQDASNYIPSGVNGWYRVNSDGTLNDTYAGLSIISLGGNKHRITINTSQVTRQGNPTQFNTLKLRGNYNDATGTIRAFKEVRINAFEVHDDGSAKIGLMGTDPLSVVTKGYIDSIIPTTYLKNASVNGNILTITKQDDSTVIYQPNLSGYVTLATDQTITGVKTFDANTIFTQNNSIIFRNNQSTNDNHWYRLVNRGYCLDIQYSTNQGTSWIDTARFAYSDSVLSNRFAPLNPNATSDLGETNNRFSTLYLKNNINILNTAGSKIVDITGGASIMNSNGNIEIATPSDGSVRFYGSSTFPSTTTQDLGRSGNKWKDLYLSGKIDFGTKVSGRTHTVHLDLDNYDGLGIWVNGIKTMNIYDNAIYLQAPIVANSGNINLGQSTIPFATTFTNNIGNGTVSDSIANIISGSQAGSTALQSSDVINNVTSTTTDKPLSANMGKDLSDRITNLESRGRHLSTWDATTGLPETYPTPTSYPYTYAYRTGDYFIVSVVGSSNLRPSGSSITKASESDPWVVGSTEETSSIRIGDYYIYDGTQWTLLQIPTSDFVTLGTSQTITGLKIFDNNIDFTTGKGITCGNSTALTFWQSNATIVSDFTIRLNSGKKLELYNSISNVNWELTGSQYDGIYVQRNNASIYVFQPSNFSPASNNVRDLGSSTLKWKNLYLSGSANLSSTSDYRYPLKISTTGTGEGIEFTNSYATQHFKLSGYGFQTDCGLLVGGNLETTGTIKIGNTTITEAQLQQLLALLETLEAQ